VFLKENARGLYSAVTNYSVTSLPVYVLKIVNAILFVLTSWPIMDVDMSTGELFANFGAFMLVPGST
jgi:ABC-type bacteriocin/lantibiotic exporter with double-glycine peptidase domain